MTDQSNTQAAKPISVERVDALRLADELEDMTCLWSPSDNRDRVERAAAELRRLAAQPTPEPVALQGRDELPQLPPRSLLALWAFLDESELVHIGLEARQKIENRVFELMQIYARSALQAARASLPAGGVVPSVQEFDRRIGELATLPADVQWDLANALHAMLPQPSETQGRRQMTDKMLKVLKGCRDTAMAKAASARVPECGDFGGIAQDLDWLVVELCPASPQDGGEKA